MSRIEIRVDELVRKAMTEYITHELVLYVGEKEFIKILEALNVSDITTFRGVPLIRVKKKEYLKIHPNSPRV